MQRSSITSCSAAASSSCSSICTAGTSSSTDKAGKSSGRNRKAAAGSSSSSSNMVAATAPALADLFHEDLKDSQLARVQWQQLSLTWQYLFYFLQEKMIADPASQSRVA